MDAMKGEAADADADSEVMDLNTTQANFPNTWSFGSPHFQESQASGYHSFHDFSVQHGADDC